MALEGRFPKAVRVRVLFTEACLIYCLPVKDSKDKLGLGELMAPLLSSPGCCPSAPVISGACSGALSPFCLFQLPAEWESPLSSRALLKMPREEAWPACPFGMSGPDPGPLQDLAPEGGGFPGPPTPDQPPSSSLLLLPRQALHSSVSLGPNAN